MLNDTLSLADLGQSLLPTVVEQCPHVHLLVQNGGQFQTECSHVCRGIKDT